MFSGECRRGDSGAFGCARWLFGGDAGVGQQQVLADAFEPLARYVTGLGQRIGGDLEWAFASTRYRDPRDPGDTTPDTELDMPTTWAAEPPPTPHALTSPPLPGG